MSGERTYGEDLPDQVDRLVNLSDAQLELLADVRELYKDRAALERDYAAKLQALARKAAEKRSKKDSMLVVGSEPTKAWGEDTLQRSTCHIAYSQIISSILDSAQAHVNLSDALASQVVDVLKGTERRHEDAKKKQEQYFTKLLSERDRVYASRAKSKQKYDEECNEVETYRLKQERSSDDRHAERAAKQYEQQQVDMLNGKNSYLIAIAVSNKVKEKFYKEDLPALEDQFQTLHSQLITKLACIMLQAQALQKNHLDTLSGHIAAAEGKIGAISPRADQDLFIEHNIRAFMLPPDWSFEPCATHYDSGDMSVESAPKIYLQNRLTKCREKLGELTPIIDAKRRDVNQLAKMVEAYSVDPKLGSAVEASDNYLEAQHQLTFYTTSECLLSAEVETIAAALSGACFSLSASCFPFLRVTVCLKTATTPSCPRDEGDQRPHAFKSVAFSIPAACVYCKSPIWGLGKQGKTCKVCGIAVHTKCELKVPADCSGSRGTARAPASGTTSATSASVSRSSSTISKLSDSQAVSGKGTFLPAKRINSQNVVEGSEVQVLEEDDGSGWIKVADQHGGRGLVPASYIELSEGPAATAPRVATVSPPRQQGSGQFVRGIYQYQAQGPDEISVTEGGLLELTGGSTGGTNYADGWWEGIDTMGKKGIFPSNYVKRVILFVAYLLT
ncbi:uncharacterized protein FIBRA_08175 [Fibroporia radiculosa]|uniref:Uncharacterized protein n=1 Tax=Fibroporia radiculosa TaxID=599839 RepID=J4IC78_9APHY|nr:uncharacterized protein FIBRA_08175 [Fibroporia radiculosa]CCM05936.1 predicted protein [Fibroporia radiculosa]